MLRFEDEESKNDVAIGHSDLSAALNGGALTPECNVSDASHRRERKCPNVRMSKCPHVRNVG